MSETGSTADLSFAPSRRVADIHLHGGTSEISADEGIVQTRIRRSAASKSDQQVAYRQERAFAERLLWESFARDIRRVIDDLESVVLASNAWQQASGTLSALWASRADLPDAFGDITNILQQIVLKRSYSDFSESQLSAMEELATRLQSEVEYEDSVLVDAMNLLTKADINVYRGVE